MERKITQYCYISKWIDNKSQKYRCFRCNCFLLEAWSSKKWLYL